MRDAEDDSSDLFARWKWSGGKGGTFLRPCFFFLASTTNVTLRDGDFKRRRRGVQFRRKSLCGRLNRKIRFSSARALRNAADGSFSHDNKLHVRAGAAELRKFSNCRRPNLYRECTECKIFMLRMCTYTHSDRHVRAFDEPDIFPQNFPKRP